MSRIIKNEMDRRKHFQTSIKKSTIDLLKREGAEKKMGTGRVIEEHVAKSTSLDYELTSLRNEVKRLNGIIEELRAEEIGHPFG